MLSYILVWFLTTIIIVNCMIDQCSILSQKQHSLSRHSSSKGCEVAIQLCAYYIYSSLCCMHDIEREKLVGELFVPGAVVSLLSLGHPPAGPGIGGCMFMYYLTFCVGNGFVLASLCFW